MAHIVHRQRYENKYSNYLDDLYEKYGGIPANHAEAIRLRMDYFKKYILDRVNVLIFRKPQSTTQMLKKIGHTLLEESTGMMLQ